VVHASDPRIGIVKKNIPDVPATVAAPNASYQLRIVRQYASVLKFDDLSYLGNHHTARDPVEVKETWRVALRASLATRLRATKLSTGIT
jgi:hypothetical protein